MPPDTSGLQVGAWGALLGGLRRSSPRNEFRPCSAGATDLRWRMEIKSLYLAVTFAIVASPLTQGAVIANGAFDTGVLSPWYVDRSFGSTRPWTIGSLDAHSGRYYAFNLGPLELRQNFTPILGSKISQFSFFVVAQFPNRGNPWVEVFYSDGGSTGPREIVLDPSHASGSSSSGWIWDKVDLLPFVDGSRQVSGVSVVGIPNNVLSIDTFSLTAVPEPSISAWLGASLAGLVTRRRRAAGTGTGQTAARPVGEPEGGDKPHQSGAEEIDMREFAGAPPYIANP